MAVQSGGRNRSPAPDMLFLKLIFQCPIVVVVVVVVEVVVVVVVVLLLLLLVVVVVVVVLLLLIIIIKMITAIETVTIPALASASSLREASSTWVFDAL